MLALHDACHFIAWRNSKSTKLELDVYRKQICTTAMRGTACTLPPPDSSTAAPIKLRKFSDGFFHTPPPPTIALAPLVLTALPRTKKWQWADGNSETLPKWTVGVWRRNPSPG